MVLRATWKAKHFKDSATLPPLDNPVNQSEANKNEKIAHLEHAGLFYQIAGSPSYF